MLIIIFALLLLEIFFTYKMCDWLFNTADNDNDRLPEIKKPTIKKSLNLEGHAFFFQLEILFFIEAEKFGRASL